jgi:retron-type reverse transcriptase
MLRDIASWENLVTAFRRIESAAGMPGADGLSLDAWRRDLKPRLEELGRDLLHAAYRPLPVLACITAGADGAPQPFFVSTVRDRTAQAAVVTVLEPLFEVRYHEDLLPHRKTGCVRHASKRVKKLHEEGFSHLVRAEIAAFFDHIDHALILDRLQALVGDSDVVDLLKQWLQAEAHDGESLFRLGRGIPRGAVMAPMLGRLFLDQLSEMLGRQGRELIRYGYDLVVLGPASDPADDFLEITPEILAHLTFDADPEDPGAAAFWRELEVLGFLFSGDGILTPFDRAPPPRTFLHVPHPLGLQTCLAGRGVSTARSDD